MPIWGWGMYTGGQHVCFQTATIQCIFLSCDLPQIYQNSWEGQRDIFSKRHSQTARMSKKLAIYVSTELSSKILCIQKVIDINIGCWWLKQTMIIPCFSNQQPMLPLSMPHTTIVSLSCLVEKVSLQRLFSSQSLAWVWYDRFSRWCQ